MRLPPLETGRFYRIWFALLQYVNTQLRLVPTFPTAPGEEEVSTEVAVQLRDALWANDGLREQFVIDNPAHLSAADLALVSDWQYRVAGSFYIFRSLQKYTIFLSLTTPAHAYGVLGLVSTIEETVPFPLPVYTQAVLLPFGHQIIYDSLLTSYTILLGPGIRRDLQETYRTIQEREGIITSLLPQDQEGSLADRCDAIRVRNRKVFTAFRRELSKTGLSPQTVEAHVQTVEDFAHTVLLPSDPPRGILDLTLVDIQSYLSQKPGKQPVTSFKRLLRFLITTGRIDYEAGEDISAFLKQRSKGMT
jgi:hypothetical protein